MKRGISGTLALTTDTKMKEIIRALWRDIPRRHINCEWHPDGIIFSCAVVDGVEIVSFTGGKLFIHNWNSIREMMIPLVPVLPPVDEEDPTLGDPVFALGETSERIQRHKKVTYTATAVNATLLTYSLDADSLLAGNTINEKNGEVNYDEDWIGDAVITCTADGGSEATTATHTATTTEAVEGEDIISLADVLVPDTTPIHRALMVYGDRVETIDDGIHYIYGKVPADEAVTEATIVIGKEYYRERIYEGFINILISVLNGADTGRSFNSDWSNSGNVTRTVPVTQVRYVDTDVSCVWDENDENTGIQIGTRQKQTKKTGSDWVNSGASYPFSETNLTVCPLPEPPAPDPSYAYIRVGNGTFDEAIATEAEITYTENIKKNISSPALSGYNNIFISIPVDRYLEIGDDIGEISTFEMLVPLDIRSGHKNNNVYRDTESFATTKSCPFWVKIKTTP